jgi:hypothetical protein
VVAGTIDQLCAVLVALLDAPERSHLLIKSWCGENASRQASVEQRGADQAQNAISSIRRWAVAASEVTMMVFASRFSCVFIRGQQQGIGRTNGLGQV